MKLQVETLESRRLMTWIDCPINARHVDMEVPAKHDIDGDGEITTNDLILASSGQVGNTQPLTRGIADCVGILPGDANMDGYFDADDMIQVFAAGKYNTLQPADWTEGNWSYNWGTHGLFDSADLLQAFALGKYATGINYQHEGYMNNQRDVQARDQYLAANDLIWGDFDFDGVRDDEWFEPDGLWGLNFNHNLAARITYAQGDLNGNRKADVGDLLIMYGPGVDPWDYVDYRWPHRMETDDPWWPTLDNGAPDWRGFESVGGNG